MYCSMCKIYAHTKRSNACYQIFAIPEFEKLTCFEIIHHPLLDGLLSPGKGSKKRTTINKKHRIFAILYSMYVEKYGEPRISMRQLVVMRSNKRKASDARRKMREKASSNKEGDDDYEEDSDETEDDDEDYDYYEPVTGV